jgi:hypothetical protein
MNFDRSPSARLKRKDLTPFPGLTFLGRSNQKADAGDAR